MSARQGPCYCDSVYCTDLVCKQLAEYRIAHRVIMEIRAALRTMPGRFGPVDLAEVVSEIESTCEILVK